MLEQCIQDKWLGIGRECGGRYLTVGHTIQLTFNQHKFELHGFTYNELIGLVLWICRFSESVDSTNCEWRTVFSHSQLWFPNCGSKILFWSTVGWIHRCKGLTIVKCLGSQSYTWLLTVQGSVSLTLALFRDQLYKYLGKCIKLHIYDLCAFLYMCYM